MNSEKTTQDNSAPAIPLSDAEKGKTSPEQADDTFVSVEQRLQDLEAKSKLSSDTIAEVQDYVKSLKEDLISIKRIRIFSVCASVIYVFAVNAALLIMIFCHKAYFAKLPAYTQIFMIAITVSSTIGLFITILKGAFKTYSERHKEDYIPPHLQTILDAVKTAKGITSDK